MANQTLLLILIISTFCVLSHGKFQDQEENKTQATIYNDILSIARPKVDPKPLYSFGDWTNRTQLNRHCSIRTLDDHVYLTINQLLAHYSKLVEFKITVANHTGNPLTNNSKWMYNLDKWARVNHNHGVTILSLAFNYGILSLMTLSFGVATVDVEVIESTHGCLNRLNEYEKSDLVMDALLRDFLPGGDIVVVEGTFICHQVIKNQGGSAKFTDQCCYFDSKTNKVECRTDMPNVWLSTLETLMAIFSISAILFGPLLTPSFFSGAGLETIRYIVKLKEPLYKTMCVVRADDREGQTVRYSHLLDLSDDKLKGFSACKALTTSVPENCIIPIKITEYNLYVSYERLLPENKVPVGFWACLIRSIFMCKMQTSDAFQGCCEANMYGCLHESRPVSWISICRVFGRILMVFFVPFPFYIRLVVYYIFEEPEIISRMQAAETAGLPMIFEFKLLQYLTPLHPLFLAAFSMYYIAGIGLAFFSTRPKKSRFQKVVTDSFRDLSDLSLLNASSMLAKNFIWPFEKLGIFGLFLGIIYWPIAMPIYLIVAALNAIPLVFLTWRLMFHALGISVPEKASLEQALPGQLRDDNTGLKIFETDNILNMISNNDIQSTCSRYFKHCHVLPTIYNVVLAVISILTFYAVVLMATECASFILNICIFTMMGIIVNASKVLKYGALIFMVILYSYDCYNNVYQLYLKLNKALFSEIKGRIKDIWEVTMLPSYLQENRGFKSQENSDQAEHESADDLYSESDKHWKINDLILFIDNNDIPRIPRKLFEEVCGIEVPGSPGPVHRSLLTATGKFFLIILFLVFVFIVVLSFGDVYKVSGTNQMLATMAGGFMPFIFRNLLKPANPAIELGSVSFKSKLEEIVINFWQCWPMYDFRFEIEEEPEDEKEEEEEEAKEEQNEDGKEGDDGGDKKGDKKDDKGDDKKEKKKDENNGDKKENKFEKKDKDKKGEKKGFDKNKKNKREEFKKKMSMAEMLDEVDYVPSKEDVLQKLNGSKTYRDATYRDTDIKIILPRQYPSDDWTLPVKVNIELPTYSLKTLSETKTDGSMSTIREGDNGFAYGINAIFSQP